MNRGWRDAVWTVVKLQASVSTESMGWKTQSREER